MKNEKQITEKVMEKLKDSKNVNHRKDHAITGSHVKEAISLAISETEKAIFRLPKNLIAKDKDDWEFELYRAKLHERQATAKAMIAEIEKWFETHATFKKDWKRGNMFFSYDEWQQLKKEFLEGKVKCLVRD